MASDTERFTKAINVMITSILKETSYKPKVFMSMVASRGAYDACVTLLRTGQPSEGFEKLQALGRLDLTMEAVVSRSEYSELFLPSDIETARQRLATFGYEVK